MNQRIERTPTFATDRDGKAIAFVPLANHDQPAKLLATDFNELMRQGISSQWTLNSNGHGDEYVRCAAPILRNLFTVARLIMRPIKGSVIRYRDSDRLNLRRDNLVVRVGRAKDRERVATEELV